MEGTRMCVSMSAAFHADLVSGGRTRVDGSKGVATRELN